jgi:hypothetical protein
MRTSLILDDQLVLRAKKLAAERRSSLSKIVNEALRNQLNTHKPKQTGTFQFPTYGRPSLPVIDSTPADISALEESDSLDAYRE